MVKVKFYNPLTDKYLSMELAGDTIFKDLTEMLYEKDFMCRQNAGYGYIANGHMCGVYNCLSDYLPIGKNELNLSLFDQVKVLL